MAQVVSAVVTDVWRAKLAGIYAGTQTFALPLSFKIGEGGWIDPGAGKEPIPPATSKTDVDPLGDGYAVDSQYVFTKDLSGADLTFTSPSRLEIRCFIAAGEANADINGNPPEFFELGVFDAVSGGGTMLVYSTFPIEIKTASKALEHVIFVDF
jgi:hypothetical protein